MNEAQKLQKTLADIRARKRASARRAVLDGAQPPTEQTPIEGFDDSDDARARNRRRVVGDPPIK